MFEYNGELGIAIENRICTVMEKNENTGKSAFIQDSVIVIICGCKSGATLKEQHTKAGSINVLKKLMQFGFIKFDGLNKHVLYKIYTIGVTWRYHYLGHKT